ncbi:MAG: hypothetical protein JRN28_00330 [Nitrososphaerota archaeon]|nr:hypothetical protein [Nitrososphaerota archaeon]
MSKLHYLYEQVADGKERFVYYCSSCNCVITARKVWGPTGSFYGLCQSCGRSLAGGTECRLVPVPEDWTDVLVDSATAVQTERAIFQPASSLPHFSLGFSQLDSLLRPLAEGRLVVLSGAPSSTVAELAALRAQLPIETGGFDSATLFIDGGNRSDPYLFSSFARQKGIRPAAAMRRVASCRVFTCYQLAALVSEHLAQVADDHGTKLIVISDLLGMFNEPELDEREARRVLGAVEAGIAKAKRRALIIVTLVSPSKYDATVTSWPDTLVQLSPDGDNVRAELVKHRNRAPGVATFKQSQLIRAARREGLR